MPLYVSEICLDISSPCVSILELTLDHADLPCVSLSVSECPSFCVTISELTFRPNVNSLPAVSL